MVRIVIIDDTRLYREGLAHILAQEPEILVLDTVADPSLAAPMVAQLQPDIVLLHSTLRTSPDMLRILTQAASNSKVVLLGVPDGEDEILACAEAGVAGYVPREGTLQDLVTTIRAVARGETLCSPRIAAVLFKRVAELADERRFRKSTVPLTPREREIVVLIDQGLSNKDIARQLSIDVRTVKNHVHNILEKLQVHRRGEAAARLRTMISGTRPILRAAANEI